MGPILYFRFYDPSSCNNKGEGINGNNAQSASCIQHVKYLQAGILSSGYINVSKKEDYTSAKLSNCTQYA